MNLEETFAVIRPDHSVDVAPVTPSLYEQLDQKYDQFRDHSLVALHEFVSDWGVWERHPAGDEIVVLLSGAATLTLRHDDGDETVALAEAGTFVIVPRNTWHTAHIGTPTRMLFITPGEGTENREQI